MNLNEIHKMTDTRKISEYSFSEMNFSLQNIISLAKNDNYAEAHLRIGSKIFRIFQVREQNGKIKLI